ncbi:MAG: glutamate racemase [Bacteroidota bacterium]|jgi:glutamate racemase
MSQKGPIGIFDSGYGGLTVLKEIVAQLPQYDYLYLGDNARAPYGTRSFDVVYEYTLQAVKELFSRNCHLVILACNTASAKALRSIQQNDLPLIAPTKRVLGVIRPSTEEVGRWTASRHIGILATEGTVKSDSYKIELAKFAPDCTVVQHACPMWVPIIENNYHHSEAGKTIIKQDVNDLLVKDPEIDLIVLACTHYPFVEEYIRSLLPSHVKVVTQGKLVANKLEEYLFRHPDMESRCSTDGKVHFLTSEQSEMFDIHASRFLGSRVQSEQIHF